MDKPCPGLSFTLIPITALHVLCPPKLLFLQDDLIGTARKLAYFRRNHAAISGQRAPFMPWLSAPSFLLCSLIDMLLEMVLCLFVLLHAPTLLLSYMMANGSRIGCQLLWVLCVEPIWPFYYIKLLSQLLREEKLKKTMWKRSGKANLLISLPTFNYLGSKNFLIKNDARKSSWRFIT